MPTTPQMTALLALLPLAFACQSPPPAPAEAPAPAAPTRVVMGEAHTCALDQGRLWCWGDNTDGQLGDGTRASRHRPARVQLGPEPVSAVAAVGRTTCALQGGAVYCWGRNAGALLGDGSFVDRAVPAPVVGLERGVAGLAAGDSGICAVRDGRAWCWGGWWTTAAPIDGVGGIDGLAIGRHLACAQTTAGARCWSTSTRVAAPLDGLPADTRSLHVFPTFGVVGAVATLCALTDGGALWCGPVRPQTDDSGRVAGYRVAPERRVEDGVTALAYENGDDLCTIRHGALRCARDALVQTWAPSMRPAQLRSIARSGYSKHCVAGDGEVTCWGNNPAGELGGVPLDEVNAHTPPGLERGVSALAGDGSGGFCAARDGRILCLDPRTRGLVEVAGLPGAIEGLSGALHAGCAISGGALLCWGRDVGARPADGALAMPESLRAAPVPGLERGVTAVSHGWNRVCALQDGGVKCWGANHRGQAIPGCADDPCPAPTPVTGLEAEVSQIAAAHSHACAVQGAGLDRRVVCWGWPDERGAMGDGAKAGVLNVLDSSLHPRADVALAVGPSRTCVAHGGELVCWGTGNAGAPRTLRQILPGGSEPAAVALGDRGGCVVSPGVRCWRDGRGAVELRAQAALTGAGEVIASGRFVCGNVGGQVRCIGWPPDYLPHWETIRPHTITLPD